MAAFAGVEVGQSFKFSFSAMRPQYGQKRRRQSFYVKIVTPKVWVCFFLLTFLYHLKSSTFLYFHLSIFLMDYHSMSTWFSFFFFSSSISCCIFWLRIQNTGWNMLFQHLSCQHAEKWGKSMKIEAKFTLKTCFFFISPQGWLRLDRLNQNQRKIPI